MTDTAAPARPTRDEPLDDGPVAPETAAMLGIVQAGLGYRSLAFAIDVVIWLVLAGPLIAGMIMRALGDTSLLSLLLIAGGWFLSGLFVLIQLILHGRRGVTTGKAALRLRSISATDLGRPGFWRVVLRALVLAASTLVLVVVGPAVLFASSLADPQRRGRSILDRIGGCWVIDARAGLDPFDAKALRHARRALRGRPDDTEELPSMASGAPAESSLRIPDARSRAGVVGPGGTGAQWALAAPGDDSVIDGVPGADSPPAAPTAQGFAPTAQGFAPTAQGFAPAAQSFAPPAAGAAAPAAAGHATPPATPAPAPAPAPTPAEVVQAAGAAPATGLRRAQAMIRFDDGSVLRVPVLGLIGRDPEPAAGETADAVVRLDDPQRLMSKTHAAFGQDAEGVWVGDRGSRNGTQLLSPGGDVVDVPAGERMRVPVGWTVQIGGRTFELVPRGADS
ncbi:RDD family protein [Microbacterium sp. CFH 31415]|uniref:RDD family protein n=1 Tax=Microbacterium sp. CFH 31415 TaxID=2921732 RepID=UPI001F13AB70|nr:RDD family protein [Microbacterium sp. CFH 31415]MCH6232039.1 RDD family protein [Microbacterium sp. CFH 31415]